MSSNEELELTFALKHIDQHLLQNDFNTKKLLKLQQRIILKEKSNVYLKLNQSELKCFINSNSFLIVHFYFFSDFVQRSC